jgi:thioredoxin reductase
MTDVQARREHHEYLIIGAGPSGLQMAYFLKKNGRDHLVLEAADEAGSFFRKFPRHRKLISINKVSTGFDDPEVNLRWDWNSLLDGGDVVFPQFSRKYFPSADTMVEYLNAFAEHHELAIRYGTRVTRVSRREGGGFVVATGSGVTFTCDRLLVATGVSRERIPDFPGVELAETYGEVSIEPEDFRDQRVLIVGKGNSGFETADNLVETTAAIHMASPEPIRLAWKTHFVGHLRAVNNNLLDTYQLKSQNTILDCDIDSVTKRDDGMLNVRILYTHADGQVLDIPVHRVILCAGFRFDPSIFDDDCSPELAIWDKFPALTAEWESVNVPELYVLGTLMQSRDYHRSFSSFIHGFRYNVAALASMFERKYHGGEWPSRPVADDPGALLDVVVDRVHSSSALFQQPEYFCDVIALSEDGEHRCSTGVPIDYVREGYLDDVDHFYALTMEYGHEEHADPFNIPRIPERGELSAFIHPVIRRYRNGEMVAEYHVPEDLENDWHQAMYLDPLLEFFESDLGTAGVAGESVGRRATRTG